MFDFLKQHDQIMVTGPHRTGTTIAAKMIAHDLEYEYYTEEKVWGLAPPEDDNAHSTTQNLIAQNHTLKKGAVYQAPLCAEICHKLEDYVAVVFMVRDVNDILASEKRIAWSDGPGTGHEINELNKYFKLEEVRQKWDKHTWDKRPVAQLKYEFWEKLQKPKITFAYELEYESLKTHEMWIQKKDRATFHSRQTETK